jgi:hypothetical protein
MKNLIRIGVAACCIGSTTSCVAQTPTASRELVEVRKCSTQSPSDKGFCLFDTVSGRITPVLALDDGDESAKMTVKEFRSAQTKQEYIVVEFAFEPDEDIPAYKDVLLLVHETRMIPLLVAPSWDPARLVDANGDGTLDLELYENPFRVRDSRWPRWPLILDGNNVLKPMRFSAAPRHIREYIQQTETAAAQQEMECRQTTSSCSGSSDVESLRRQAAEMKVQVALNKQ